MSVRRYRPPAFRAQASMADAQLACGPRMVAGVQRSGMLQGVINKALANNLDIQVAVARCVEQARALVGVANAEALPQIGYQGSAGAERTFLPLPGGAERQPLPAPAAESARRGKSISGAASNDRPRPRARTCWRRKMSARRCCSASSATSQPPIFNCCPSIASSTSRRKARRSIRRMSISSRCASRRGATPGCRLNAPARTTPPTSTGSPT